jgi:hypothetical protein
MMSVRAARHGCEPPASHRHAKCAIVDDCFLDTQLCRIALARSIDAREGTKRLPEWSDLRLDSAVHATLRDIVLQLIRKYNRHPG